MKERFRPSDYRFIAVCVVLFAATAWFSALNFYRAFPEASIDFRVNRDEGRELARAFLSSHGYRFDTYRQASTFTFDDSAKTFLEREAGLEKANSIMETRVRMWRWSYRWFQPLQKEEFRADITARGELAGFEHQLPEDAPRPEIPASDARSLAEQFLRERMRLNPDTLDFVETSDVARPHRTDRVFIWKDRDFNLRESTYRFEVTILGNEVGAYREYLKVPEQWQRDYSTLRSKNEAAQLVDSAFLVLLIVGLIAVIVIRVRRQDVRWRRAAFIGMVGMVLTFGSQLNEFAQHEFSYPTADSYSSFVTRQLVQAIITALGAGGLLFVLAAGAEPMYREAFPEKISLGMLFRMRGLRTRRFFLGAVLGVTLTSIFIAYQTAFYIVAYRYGAWSPADVPYSDLLNTRFPWLFVLIGGYLPAVSEEFLFRMFAIPFLRKLARSMAVAVVVAGFLWGFGHAGYPQQPFYIRGVEVGIGGVALGFVMLRWGILPTLVWHYSVDAMYSAMLLLRSQSLYYRLSGAASAGIIVLPVLIALVAYWRKGGFEPETGLLNADETPPPEVILQAPAPESATVADYLPTPARRRLIAVALLPLGLLALLIPAARFGDAPRYRLTREQARAAADAFLASKSFSTSEFTKTTYPSAHWSGPDSLAGKYFLERRDVPFVSRMFENYRPVQRWATRYFKSLDVEEFTVSVHPETGKILAFVHKLPESRPGADLRPEQARQVASTFAAAEGRNVESMQLKETTSERKKSRRDHSLDWEAPDGDPRNLDETRYRVHAEVSGDQVSALGAFWKVPESFSRARERRNLLANAITILRIGVIGTIVVWGIMVLIHNIRAGLVPWRVAITLAIPAALLTGLAAMLSMPTLLQNYRTEIPLQTFQAMMYVIVGMSVIFGFVMQGGAAAFLTSSYPKAVSALQSSSRRLLGIDALCALIGAAGLGLLLQQLRVLLLDRFHAHAVMSIDAPDLIISYAPGVAAIAAACGSLLTYSAALGVIVLILQRLSRSWIVWAVVPLALFALLPSDVRTAGEFALHYGLACITAASVVAYCFFVVRRNYLAWALILWVMTLRNPLSQLLGTPQPSLQMQGWMVVAVIAAVVVAAVLPAFTHGRAEAAPVTATLP